MPRGRRVFKKTRKITNVGKAVEKRKPVCTVGDKVKGSDTANPFKTELPCDPAMPPLGIYPE